MKIAIIGSGISGLTAAYVLNKNHDIRIFEANNYIGGHTHTHDINIKGKEFKVDTGFIVYNERTYPNFIKLLDILGVERQLSTMGFSVKSISKDYEYAGESLNSLFAKRSNIFRLGFLKMLYEMYYFGKKADAFGLGLDTSITLGDYLKKENIPLPEKSACIVCPYHNDAYWHFMKTERPSEFADAVDFDKQVRNISRKEDEQLYSHRSCKPLDEVEFDKKETDKQLDMFNNECEGMCGV